MRYVEIRIVGSFITIYQNREKDKHLHEFLFQSPVRTQEKRKQLETPCTPVGEIAELLSSVRDTSAGTNR